VTAKFNGDRDYDLYGLYSPNLRFLVKNLMVVDDYDLYVLYGPIRVVKVIEVIISYLYKIGMLRTAKGHRGHKGHNHLLPLKNGGN
jgi:hypothetical protein